MRPIDETVEILKNIEVLLKSIDYQLTKIAISSSPSREKEEPSMDQQNKPRLLTTREASQMFGLSEYELRRGYKEGIYPAIEIGGGEKWRKLRWRSDLLEETLKKGK